MLLKTLIKVVNVLFPQESRDMDSRKPMVAKNPWMHMILQTYRYTIVYNLQTSFSVFKIISRSLII